MNININNLGINIPQTTGISSLDVPEKSDTNRYKFVLSYEAMQYLDLYGSEKYLMLNMKKEEDNIVVYFLNVTDLIELGEVSKTSKLVSKIDQKGQFTSVDIYNALFKYTKDYNSEEAYRVQLVEEVSDNGMKYLKFDKIISDKVDSEPTVNSERSRLETFVNH